MLLVGTHLVQQPAPKKASTAAAAEGDNGTDGAADGSGDDTDVPEDRTVENEVITVSGAYL